MNPDEEIKQAQQNVQSLQTQANQVNTLLTKWQGILEYLQQTKQKEEENTNSGE